MKIGANFEDAKNKQTYFVKVPNLTSIKCKMDNQFNSFPPNLLAKLQQLTNDELKQLLNDDNNLKLDEMIKDDPQVSQNYNRFYTPKINVLVISFLR